MKTTALQIGDLVLDWREGKTLFGFVVEKNIWEDTSKRGRKLGESYTIEWLCETRDRWIYYDDEYSLQEIRQNYLEIAKK